MWEVVEDEMIPEHWKIVDTSVRGTMAQFIDWHGISYGLKEEAETMAAALNRRADSGHQ